MKADKKDSLKKALKLADNAKPVEGFTENVMRLIEADVKTEVALKSLLKQEEAVGPAFHFTANIMAQIVASKQASVYKPIITRKAWYAIAAMMVAFFLLIGLSNQSTKSTGHKNLIVDAINSTHAIPPAYLMAMVVVAVLLFADYILTRLKDKTETV